MALGARSLLRLAALAAALAALAAGLASCSSDPPADPPGSGSPARFVPPVEAERATVWAIGDGANGNPQAVEFGNWIADQEPERFLYLGDVYERGTFAEFATSYEAAYGRLAEVTAPTPGNHEWPNRRKGYRPYWRDRKGVERVPNVYAFRVAGWQILSLNSEIAHGPRSRQLRWIERRVKPGGTCRIAFAHKPRLSAGAHRDPGHMVPLWRALRGHARLFLSGHDHNAQRFRARSGLVQLVVGSGGRERYPVGNHPDLVWANDTDLVGLRIRLGPGRARFAFVRDDGEVLHRGSVGCRPA